MSRARLAVLLVVLLCAASARAADEGGAAEVVLDQRLRVPVPAGMTHEQRSLGPRGEMLTLAGNGDAMVITVYRKGVDDDVPSPGDALAAHADELARALGAPVRKAGKRRALGRSQPSVELTAGATSGWVVAFDARGRTVVVSAVWASDSADALAAILDGIAFR